MLHTFCFGFLFVFKELLLTAEFSFWLNKKIIVAAVQTLD